MAVVCWLTNLDCWVRAANIRSECDVHQQRMTPNLLNSLFRPVSHKKLYIALAGLCEWSPRRADMLHSQVD